MAFQVSKALTVALGMAALLAMAAASAAAQSPNDPLPEGQGKGLVLRACSSCHQPAMIVSKRRTAQEWDEVIGKMVGRGAQLTDAEQDQVYAYLLQNFGPKPAEATQAGRPQGATPH